MWASRAERGRTNVPQARRPSPTGAAGGRCLWPQSQQRLLDVFSKLLSTAALSPRRESPLRLICSAGSQGYEGAPSDTGERAPRGMDLGSGYQDIGGTWRPKAAGTRKQGRIPLKKERCRKNVMLAEQSRGKDKKQTRALLPRSPLGARPRAPRYLSGRRRPAALLCAACPSGARTMRRFQTWLRSRSRRAGAGAGGKEKAGWPPAPATLPTSGGGATPRGRGGRPAAGAGEPRGKRAQVGPGSCRGRPAWAKDVRGRSQSQLSSH